MAAPTIHAHRMVAETIATGQTADAITTVPAATVDGSRFALYDGDFALHNGGASGFGGMLTFITVGTSTSSGDTVGPATSALTLSPNPTNGSVDVALTATIDDVNAGGSNIQAAEFYIDSTAGTATALSASDAAFDSPTEAVGGTITAATLAGLSAGSHTIYVRGQDAAGNWGAFNHITLNLDKAGPATTGLTLTPDPSNGTANVALHATGNDLATGGSNIAAAEYTIDSGTAVPMTVNSASSVASLDATIPAATVNRPQRRDTYRGGAQPGCFGQLGCHG